MSLFVITKVNNPKELAGIPHTHAVQKVHGGAVFGFRKLPTALKLARAIDTRIIKESGLVFTEDLIEPISNLSIGKYVRIKQKFSEDHRLQNVSVCRTEEDQLTQYVSALCISVILFEERGDGLVVNSVISPGRSLAFSAGYLDFLFHEK